MKTVEQVFEVSGYFEELSIQIGDSFKVLGTRSIPNPQPSRQLGVYGKVEHMLTESVVLTKGHKQVIIKASPEKPIHCTGVANALCGRIR